MPNHQYGKIERSLIQEEQRRNEKRQRNDNTESEQVFYSKDKMNKKKNTSRI